MAAENTTPVLPIYRKLSHLEFHERTYQASFLEIQRGPYLNFPAVISIETLSLCNAACEFCPYPGLARKGEAMPDRVIQKILDDIQGVSGRPAFEVTLARVNEPFLDSRVLDLSVEIEERFPEATNMFFSNGTPLTEKTLLRLAGLQRVSYLMVSVNDHRRDEYERIMRLPFDRTLTRLDLIQRMKDSGILRFPVYVSRVADGSAADGEFLEWVRRSYPALSGLVTPRGDWMGVVAAETGPVPDVGCRQWFQLHVLSNGKAAFCCIDSDGRHGTGDARTQHVIHEVYNHPARRSLRSDVLSRREVRACQTCTMLP
jgi:hypothetical protein